ncbi:MAG: hypothetical protein RL219_2279 [Actinomycetota bacterium]
MTPAHAGVEADTVPGSPPDSAPVTSVDEGGPVVAPPTSAVPTTAVDPLPTLPPECDPPDAPDVVFVGRIVDAANGVGRFVVRVIRNDPTGLLAIGRPVDVRIGDDLRFLVYGNDYLVAADHTPDNALRSKVRRPEAIFGGDQVVGADDFGVQCPALSDPIVVRNDDGSAVDTGVLNGFFDDKRGLALAVAIPVLAVAVLLVAVWALRRLVGSALRRSV